MAEAVSEGFRVASSVLDSFLKAREEPIVDPLETIRKIAEARQFSQKLADEVMSSYLVEPEANRFGVINAFTDAAQKLGPLQRIEMEQFWPISRNVPTQLQRRDPPDYREGTHPISGGALRFLS